MKQFTPLLLLLAALSTVTAGHAASVHITDTLAAGGSHTPICHWEQFSTTLSASADTVEPEAETTITGPVYAWSGGSSQVHLTSTSGQTTGLESTSGTELTPGQHTVNIQCNATYTRTKNGQTLSPIVLTSGTFSVTFWSRKPVSLKSLDSDPVHGTATFHGYIPAGYPSRNEFQQYAQYAFAVLDNQPTAAYYGSGKVHEIFGSLTTNPNYSAAIVNQGAPGPEATKANSGGTFIDGNGWTTGDFKQPNKWPQTLVDATYNAGANDFWYSFPQTWEYLEQAPGDADFIRATTLTPSFTVSFFRDYVERH